MNRQANWIQRTKVEKQQVLEAPIPNTKDVVDQKATRKRFRTLADERINIFLGRTGFGKTNLLRYCIKQGLRQQPPLWDRIFVLCPTAKCSGDYDWLKTVDPNCVITEVSTQKLGRLVTDCKKHAESTRPLRTLIVLDDCLGIMRTRGNDGKIFEELSASCRHGHITCAILVQGLALGCPPIVRTNAEVTYASGMGLNDMKYMEECAPQNMDKHQLHNIIRTYCTKYQFVRFSKIADEEMPIVMPVPRCALNITVTR